jgi:hypothetical protein
MQIAPMLASEYSFFSENSTMQNYDPDHTPDPAQWLALDEQHRIMLAADYHRAKRVKLPNLQAHAVFHAIVENQLAEGLESVVRAMPRLAKQGLSRHDCVHAIGWVLAVHLHELMASGKPEDPTVANARYDATVERLSATAWLKQEEI